MMIPIRMAWRFFIVILVFSRFYAVALICLRIHVENFSVWFVGHCTLFIFKLHSNLNLLFVNASSAHGINLIWKWHLLWFSF